MSTKLKIASEEIHEAQILHTAELMHAEMLGKAKAPKRGRRETHLCVQDFCWALTVQCSAVRVCDTTTRVSHRVKAGRHHKKKEEKMKEERK